MVQNELVLACGRVNGDAMGWRLICGCAIGNRWSGWLRRVVERLHQWPKLRNDNCPGRLGRARWQRVLFREHFISVWRVSSRGQDDTCRQLHRDEQSILHNQSEVFLVDAHLASR